MFTSKKLFGAKKSVFCFRKPHEYLMNSAAEYSSSTKSEEYFAVESKVSIKKDLFNCLLFHPNSISSFSSQFFWREVKDVQVAPGGLMSNPSTWFLANLFCNLAQNNLEEYVRDDASI